MSKLTVLPGIELRSDQGAKPIHYICIFPEDCVLQDVWTSLQGKLGLTPTDIAAKGGDHEVYVPIEDASEAVKELGGVISIHAGGKSNSIEEIRNAEKFQQRLKLNITNHFVDLLEIGQINDVDVHLNTIFPKTGLNHPLIICSDNHNINSYEVKVPLWFRADPTFRGLLMVLREPRDRIFIGDKPEDLLKVEQNPTKFIDSISFKRGAGAPDNQKWFTGSVEFNPGLVAIVGNKGSGKSALADTIGLLGATKNSKSFSFLSPKRFRHRANGYASHFTSTLTWRSGDEVTKTLSDPVAPDEVEMLKCLPQEHVEKVCNELEGIEEHGFEQELGAVIFSHVPKEQRLGCSSLNELIEFQTGEKQKRIDSLIKQLRQKNRTRAALELQADPKTKSVLAEKIERKKLEIAAHDKAKPSEVENPDSDKAKSTADPSVLKKIADAEERQKKLTEKIETAERELQKAKRRQAVAERVLERLGNFRKDYDSFVSDLHDDVEELGLQTSDLVELKVLEGKPKEIVSESKKSIVKITGELDQKGPPGLRLQLKHWETQIEILQTQLDAPNRAYQSYLGALKLWQAKRDELVGSIKAEDSLKWLESSLSSLEKLPTKIEQLRDEQLDLAEKIHQEKMAQSEVFRLLYHPVQDFIDTHDLSTDKLTLEFRAELTHEGFGDDLLGMLNLNRVGSFKGVEQGRERVESYSEITNWQDWASVHKFLLGIDESLHHDYREGQEDAGVQLADQVTKGKAVEDVYNLLYGLEYVRPKYALRWDGKDLSTLSPGERGTLLLVFYLLIDRSDLPLIIDQPEGNLDNHTVAKVLVQCIKEARKRRQVFIVTHNPNLAVVCDADQIVHTSIDKKNGNQITYTTGALENPVMSQHVTDVLEGTRWAFDVRGNKYEVGKGA